MDQPFIGQIMLFAGNFAPRGWALCDGQVLAIADNNALFAILGTTYGGNGRTTFQLPDLRGRSAVHFGTGIGLTPIQLGQRSGFERHTLSILEMPVHSHGGSTLRGAVEVNEEDGDDGDPKNRNLGVSGDSTPYNTFPTNGAMGTNPATGNVAIGGNTLNAGGSQSFNIRNPYLGLNYVIALVGLFPSRN